MDKPPFSAGRAADSIPALAGIGLRFPHHDLVMRERPDAGWFEVHPENYLSMGVAAEILETIRDDYLLSLHATGLSLGSAQGVDPEHLDAIAAFCRHIAPGLVSDHLSWSAAAGLHLPDLLPLPYTQEALDIFACNIDRVQDALGRSILIENPSVYLSFADADMEEADFLGHLVSRTGCGVLLDVNNVAVSAANLGQESGARLNALLNTIPPAAIGEIHLAGHAIRELPDGTKLRIDDHGSPVSPEVWTLFEHAIAHIGPRPVLIEWDTAIPPFEVLAREAAIADALMSRPAAKESHGHAIPG